MNDDTYRWLTAVWTPLLSVLVTAVVSGGVAIIATRMEAKRGEKRAQAEALKGERTRAVLATWEWLMARVEASASGLMNPSATPLTHEPIEADVTLIGDASTASFALELINRFSGRPGRSGLSTQDVHDIAEATNRLRTAALHQLEVVAGGQHPTRFALTELEPVLTAASQQLDQTPRGSN